MNKADSAQTTNMSIGNILLEETKEPTSYLRAALPSLAKAARKRRLGQKPSPEAIENYTMEKVQAVRFNDISTLQRLLDEGESLDACNRNGETLLHLACRRGNVETVKFLVHEAQCDPDAMDDMGRSVLHDICWRPSPDIDMMDTLLQLASPDLLLAEDVRGHTCFDYCRKEHWGKWTAFLLQSSSSLARRANLISKFP